jgi:hypothetical protein
MRRHRDRKMYLEGMQIADHKTQKSERKIKTGRRGDEGTGRNMKMTCFFLAVLALLSGSCTSSRKAIVKDIDWGSRIGTYTYEEALTELGEPHVIGQSSEGKFAEWVLERSPNVAFSFGFGSGALGHHTSTGVGVGTTVSPPPSGEYLHLTFDNDGKLAEWTRVKY